MAIVEEGQMQETGATDQGKLTIPNIHDVTALQQLRQHVVQMTGKYGVPTLLKNIDTLLRHKGLFDRSSAIVVNSIKRLNGEPTGAQKAGYQKRSVTNTAQRFYEACSEKELLALAKAAGLNPNMYEENTELIAALVQWKQEQAQAAEAATVAE